MEINPFVEARKVTLIESFFRRKDESSSSTSKVNGERLQPIHLLWSADSGPEVCVYIDNMLCVYPNGGACGFWRNHGCCERSSVRDASYKVCGPYWITAWRSKNWKIVDSKQMERLSCTRAACCKFLNTLRRSICSQRCFLWQ